MILHFMQIDSDNLHEVTDLINKNYNFKMSSAEMFTLHAEDGILGWFIFAIFHRK